MMRIIKTSKVIEQFYWDYVPQFHRCWRYSHPKYVNYPIDPFETILVDPDRITQFSAREYPIWRNKWQSFGLVLDGDWDRRNVPPVRSHNGPDLSLYLADRFTETPLHEGLKAHFVGGVPWEDTEFIQHVLQEVQDSTDGQSVWHKCSTETEIRERCRFLDRLYADMQQRGCLSARQLNATNGRQKSFSWVMRNEILTDVGRNGELLFVTGRHRLSIAKILGLDRIPIAITARHAKWLDQREEHQEGSACRPWNHRGEEHPDLLRQSGPESRDVSW